MNETILRNQLVIMETLLLLATTSEIQTKLEERILYTKAAILNSSK